MKRTVTWNTNAQSKNTKWINRIITMWMKRNVRSEIVQLNTPVNWFKSNWLSEQVDAGENFSFIIFYSPFQSDEEEEEKEKKKRFTAKSVTELNTLRKWLHQFIAANKAIFEVNNGVVLISWMHVIMSLRTRRSKCVTNQDVIEMKPIWSCLNSWCWTSLQAKSFQPNSLGIYSTISKTNSHISTMDVEEKNPKSDVGF